MVLLGTLKFEKINNFCVSDRRKPAILTQINDFLKNSIDPRPQISENGNLIYEKTVPFRV